MEIDGGVCIDLKDAARSKGCCQLCRLSKGISSKGDNRILGLKA